MPIVDTSADTQIHACQALAAAGKLDSNAVISGDVSRSRKEAREAMERKRVEEADRERIRQQKRINFLLTQTELFAHFIGQKMEGITETPSAAAAPVEPEPAPAPAGVAPALSTKDAERIAAAKKKGQLDKTETREALASAQAALQNRQRSMNLFDEEAREAKKLSKKNDQALVNSLDDAALQHKDVNLTAEAASIFNGTLKAYQKIGIRTQRFTQRPTQNKNTRTHSHALMHSISTQGSI
jgi:DNA helicase INO80